MNNNYGCGFFIVSLVVVAVMLGLIWAGWTFGWICYLPDPEHWTRCN